MSNMSAEFTAIMKHINSELKNSALTEQEKYALLAGCTVKVAHNYHKLDFEAIKIRITLVSKTMLDSVDAAERIVNKVNHLKKGLNEKG